MDQGTPGNLMLALVIRLFLAAVTRLRGHAAWSQNSEIKLLLNISMIQFSARELQWYSAYHAQVHRLSQSAGLPRDRGHLPAVGECGADQGAAGVLLVNLFILCNF